jgi:hypothetical protein
MDNRIHNDGEPAAALVDVPAPQPPSAPTAAA